MSNTDHSENVRTFETDIKMAIWALAKTLCAYIHIYIITYVINYIVTYTHTVNIHTQ